MGKDKVELQLDVDDSYWTSMEREIASAGFETETNRSSRDFNGIFMSYQFRTLAGHSVVALMDHKARGRATER